MISRDRHRTVAFSGHRTYKMGADDPARVASLLRGTLLQLAGRGYDTFLSGMAEGFDLLAAEQVLLLKKDFPHVWLAAVVPFSGQAARFRPADALRWRGILSAADHVEILAESYDSRCFHRRNDLLLANSSLLVCYYNGTPGGTRYCWERAGQMGHERINLSAYGEPVTGRLF